MEDFKSVNLKSSSLPLNQLWLPFSTLMLLHIKGRRNVQTRLVEPTYRAINGGDCFILVTSKKLFNFNGRFANVIEKSRSKDICAQIIRDKDLGCTAESVVQVTAGTKEFWNLLGAPDSVDICGAGHPDEDELFETSLHETNMVWEFQDGALVPVEEYWGQIPSVTMLDAKKVFVFHFGSETYVWSGKNADSHEKLVALKLAQDLFETPFDYSPCDVCPIDFSLVAGCRAELLSQKQGAIPSWCLLAKITQHMETVLFREKFLDWPDIMIQFKEDASFTDEVYDIVAPSGKELFVGCGYEEPNLILENSNLGRGNFYYCNETMRHFDILTEFVKKWHVGDENYEEVENEDDYCHFYANESFTVRWIYRISITVRELSGKVSAKSTVGRDRCAYFCWHGANASPNDKGAAALATVELDKEKGSQTRIVQGEESTVFVRLFKVMFVHRSKSSEARSGWRLYISSGNCLDETVLTEVLPNMRQLRSRTSLLLISDGVGKIIVWHGCKSAKHSREVAVNAANLIARKKYKQLFEKSAQIDVEELDEGTETDEFFEAVESKNRQLYHSLVNTVHEFTTSPRLFQFSSTSGSFKAVELIDNFRIKNTGTPYPFNQNILYKARQPAIFMLDNDYSIWLWFGWWPNTQDSLSPKLLESAFGAETNVTNDNRSGVNRWQAERKAAMQTAVEYWKAKYDSHGKEKNLSAEVSGYIVWAGLEPVEFKSLFPSWENNDEVAEINIQVNMQKHQL